MRGPLGIAVGLTAAGLLATAVPALAGAPNYVCRFGDLRIVADVHLDGLHARGSGTPLQRLDVPTYGSGGSGFTASRGRLRYEVELVEASTVTMLVRTPSELVRTSPSGTSTRRGLCTLTQGNYHAGWVTKPSTVIRTHARVGAPAVTDDSALPFVWSVPITAPAGWVAVRLLRADGRHADGFAPASGVRFAT